MRRVLANDDVARLARSAERLVRLAQAINERAKEWDGPEPQPVPVPAIAGPDLPAVAAEPLVQAARDAIRAHRSRPDFGAPGMFHARAWPLMLELFIAESCGDDMPVKSACLALGGSQTSALRCILDLERLSVVESRSDEKDGRRRLLKLSASARRQLEDYLAQCGGANGGAEGHRPIRVSLRMTTRSLTDDETAERGSCDIRPEVAPGSARSGFGIEMVSQ
jgi:DNA-binding MarR family transcriptional regulator